MQNQSENKAYAGFFVRLVAYAIDSMLAALLVSIVKLPLSIAASAGAGFLKANFIFHYSLLDVLGYIGVAAYFVLLTYFAHGTPGKLLFRLRVVTEDREWTFLNILYRETVGRFLSSLLCIGYLAIIVTEKKQGFHDMLSDTYVVYAGMAPVAKPEAETSFVRLGKPEPADSAVSLQADKAGEESSLQAGKAGEESSLQPGKAVGGESSLQSGKAESLNGQGTGTAGETTAPIYHTRSAFEMQESHPISVEPDAGADGDV